MDALEHASADLQGDKDFVMEAVKQDGWVLQFASADLKGDKDIVMEAVKQYGYALEYASPICSETRISSWRP